MTNTNIPELESLLDDPNLATREDALDRLKTLADKGEVPVAPRSGRTNMHCHTFYSYNAYGYSPQHVAWAGYRAGLAAMAAMGFDTLDGMEEFLATEPVLGMKTVAGMETRAFVRAYADRVINSPGEPGVTYFVGIGFRRRPAEGSRAAATLRGLAGTARRRNLDVLARVNAFLSPVSVDYDRDVLPLTPSGNATERHLLRAWAAAAARRFPGEAERAAFWAGKLKLTTEAVLALFRDEPAFHERMRAVLIKRGGPGYVPPDAETFPPLEEVVRMIRESGAIPSCAWLDGTSEGESDIAGLLAFYRDQGAPVVTVIPDRNWNLKDPKEKAVKVAKLHECLDACRRLGLRVIAGTEMNKAGHKTVDDFDVPELAPYAADFARGAEWVHAESLKS